MNGACDLQALSCQGSGQQIIMLACRCLREQGVDERLALLVSELLVPLQASFQQDTRTSDRPLSQGDLSKEAKEPAGCPRVVGLSMDGDSFLQQGPSFPLIPLLVTWVIRSEKGIRYWEETGIVSGK